MFAVVRESSNDSLVWMHRNGSKQAVTVTRWWQIRLKPKEEESASVRPWRWQESFVQAREKERRNIFKKFYHAEKTQGQHYEGRLQDLQPESNGRIGSNRTSTSTSPEIEWYFQPLCAPRFGGSHESLVESTKKILYWRFAYKRPSIDSTESLQTLLFEVAGMLNTRPLGYVSSELKDFRPQDPTTSWSALSWQVALQWITKTHNPANDRCVEKITNIF